MQMQMQMQMKIQTFTQTETTEIRKLKEKWRERSEVMRQAKKRQT
jgi:hypothetical protein